MIDGVPSDVADRPVRRDHAGLDERREFTTEWFRDVGTNVKRMPLLVLGVRVEPVPVVEVGVIDCTPRLVVERPEVLGQRSQVDS